MNLCDALDALANCLSVNEVGPDLSQYVDELACTAFTDDQFIAACYAILAEDTCFPTVARLIEAARQVSPPPVPVAPLPALTSGPVGDRTMPGATWEMPRLPDGKPDYDAWYIQSRILRGLDPAIDERPTRV